MSAASNLSKLVKSNKLRMTRGRRSILRVLQEFGGHLDVEEIFLRARQQDQNISLATVYRAVAFLKAAGLISEHSLGQDHSHYEAVTETAHYHFTCLGCGKVIEFSDPRVDVITKRLIKKYGISVKNVHLLIEGYCRQCQQNRVNIKISSNKKESHA
jgi:Fur family ferric uptake transcriptional regulator